MVTVIRDQVVQEIKSAAFDLFQIMSRLIWHCAQSYF